MSRLARMQRIGSILELRETNAKTALAAAERSLDQANDAVAMVLEQCRDTARRPGAGDLPFAAARLILDAGRMEASHRETLRDEAAQLAIERRRSWQREHQRREAAAKLLDRWREDHQLDLNRQADNQLDDLINARNLLRNHSQEARP